MRHLSTKYSICLMPPLATQFRYYIKLEKMRYSKELVHFDPLFG